MGFLLKLRFIERYQSKILLSFEWSRKKYVLMILSKKQNHPEMAAKRLLKDTLDIPV